MVLFIYFLKYDNGGGGGGGGEIRFVRVVRASANSLGAGRVHYFITLEALCGKADMNVYYAEVLDCPDQNLMRLIKWELVNESFSYPFEELRYKAHAFLHVLIVISRKLTSFEKE